MNDFCIHLCAHMCTYVPDIHRNVKRALDSLWTKDANGYESPDGCWELNLGLLQEQGALHLWDIALHSKFRLFL